MQKDTQLATPDVFKKILENILSLYNQRDYQACQRAVSKALESFPDQVTCLQILGVCQRQQGQLTDSVTTLERAVSLQPNNIQMLISLSESLFQQRLHERLISVLTRILQLGHSEEKLYNYLCESLLSLYRNSEADFYAKQGLIRFPASHTLNYFYSVILKNAGQLKYSIYHARDSLNLRFSDKTFISPQKPTPDYNNSHTKKLLFEELAAFKTAGFRVFPTGGTLLGLVREGGLLSRDKDIDLGIPFEKINDAVHHMEARGWAESPSHQSLINPRQMIHKATGIVIDLCGYREEKPGSGLWIGGFWMRNIPWEWNRITEFPRPIFITTESPAGEICWLENAEEWLEVLYGDWQIPDSEFDTIICAKNLRGYSPLVECYALHRIYFYWLKGNVSKALKLVNSALEHAQDDLLLIRLKNHFQGILSKA